MDRFCFYCYFLLISVVVTLLAPAVAGAQPTISASDASAIEKELLARGVASIIVELPRPRGIFDNELSKVGNLEAVRTSIKRFLSELNLSDRTVTQLRLTPTFSIEITHQELELLLENKNVIRISSDRKLKSQQDKQFIPDERLGSIRTSYGRTVNAVGAAVYDIHGFGGRGTIIVVIDSGVDASHQAFAGRIVDQHCFSTQNDEFDSTCPGSGSNISGHDAAKPCRQQPACDHGTSVASVAVGFRVTPRWPGPYSDAATDFLGMAPLADLYPIQVMSLPRDGGEPIARTINVAQALEHVYLHRSGFPGRSIAAVNLSINDATALTADACDDGPLVNEIRFLKSVNIATVISAGNQSDKSQVAWPACISDAIVVASSSQSDTLARHSNFGRMVDFFAPGELVDIAKPSDRIEFGGQGTSYAAPHVTGAIAAVKSWSPSLSTVDSITRVLRDGGRYIEVNGMRRPRIDLHGAFREARPNTIWINPREKNLRLCPSCKSLDVELRVTDGQAAWNVVESPSWAAIAGQSGRAPATIKIFPGPGYADFPLGTRGIIRIRNLSVNQPDIVINISKDIDDTSKNVIDFRLERLQHNKGKLPGAEILPLEVVVTEDGKIVHVEREFWAPIPNMNPVIGERFLHGNRQDYWEIESIPPWFRLSPTSGRFQNPWTSVNFNPGLETEVAKLEPNREHRATLRLQKKDKPGEGIELSAIMNLYRPPNSSYFYIANPVGPHFTGPRGGPFTSRNPDITIAKEGGFVRWELFDLPTWLNASPMSGVAPSVVTFAISEEARFLPPGEYATFVVFRNRTGYQRPQTKAITLVIAPP